MNDTETFQHYQVLRRADGSLWELGRGAMGVTYKAFDTNLRCHVALKVISGQLLDSETARARFLREARAAAGLRHRNIASVYHLGNDADSFFYSMEFIDGDTVASLVADRGPLPAADALQIALQVTRALGAAAKQGVVHRDIKPANLMVLHEDEDEEQGFVVKVIDFGLARSVLTGGEHSAAITLGGFVGTPQYASPEQIEERDLDVRSDIYSLGITLWYMLAGQPPFTGTVFRVSSQHLTKEPPWADIEATVPPSVRALLGRMLQKDPALRPETPAKLRAEIDACLRQLPAQPVRATDIVLLAEEAADLTIVPRATPLEGRLFAGRYQLVERVGEGASGRTFRAYDNRLDGKLVALKIFAPALPLGAQAFARLQGDLERLRAAPHPQLIQPHGLERLDGDRFLVMEWVNGYPLAESLHLRGAWPLPEALRLLGLVADAATHGRAQRLHGLELDPRKILLGFPEVGDDDPPPGAETLAERSLHQWPRFTLKLDALNPAREVGQSSVPGGVSGGSPSSPERDLSVGRRGMTGGGYFRALALLFHELMGGKLPPPDRAQDFLPLPGLNEAGDALLRRACADAPDFATENAWFDALLDATGQRREGFGLPRIRGDAPTRFPGTVAPPPQAPANPPETFRRPPLEERTHARDEAATLIELERPDPFPAAPVEARVQPEPAPEVFRAPMAPLAVLAPRVPTALANAEPEAVTFAPSGPTKPPPARAATVSPAVAGSSAKFMSRPVPPPVRPPVPPVFVPAKVSRPGSRKFPLVLALSIAALVIGGVVVLACSRPHPDTPARTATVGQTHPSPDASVSPSPPSSTVATDDTLAGTQPTAAETPPVAEPTLPATVETASGSSGSPEPTPPSATAAPVPIVAQVHGAASPPEVPVATPRHGHKVSSSTPAPKASQPPPTPGKGAAPGKIRVVPPRPPPAKSLKPVPTPPRDDEEVPAFMR